MSTHADWHPSWWKQDVHGSAWDRVKEAMHRDWIQTKHDLGISSGHELNQTVGDTTRQMTGKESIPVADTQANPPKVIGNWDDAEIPYGFGYAARRQYGSEYPQWTPELETRLSDEWESGVHAPIDWSAAKGFVRRGYDWNDDGQTQPGKKPR